MRVPQLLCLFVLLLGVPAVADDGAMDGIGGAMRPMKEHPAIIMDEMRVDARLTTEVARVECRFRFRNTGKATTVQMGFPESGYGDASGAGFTAFQSWVDGKRVPTRVVPSATPHYEGYERWQVKSVRFREGQVRNVRVSYSAGLGRDISGSRFFSYRVGTGGSWKGPIGNARVTVHLGYDPSRFALVPEGGLTRVGQRTLVWRRMGYEPKLTESISLRLDRTYYQIEVPGNRIEGIYPGDDPHIIGAHLWVPVRRLAGWTGAELSVDGHRASLVLGSRQVLLQSGDQFMDVSGSHIGLARPLFVSHGRLFAPLRAVAEALGAEVLGRARWVRLRPPLEVWLEGGTTSTTTAGGVSRMVGISAPGFSPPELSQFDVDAREFGARVTRMPPWLAVGDFNGDGSQDVALLLCKGEMSATLLAQSKADGSGQFEPHWLSRPHAADRTLGARGGLFTALRAVPPGAVAFWQEHETTPKSGRLDLKHDGIEVIAVGKAAVLHYWDEREQVYKSVVTAD